MNVRGRNFGTKAITRKNAAAGLALLLSACKDENLATFTAEQLAGSWNVSPANCATMLNAERARRGRLL